ncbi:MAG: aryl-sulfate sulfotransferase [Acidobacteria bacterium]|nr:aryl-sulfate sulfotransferase [Acidobacteriota bacterium]
MRTTLPPTSVPAIGAQRRPNGDLSWMGFASNPAYGTDPNRGWEIHGLNGSLKRVVKTVGSATDHHEMIQLANGNDLAISYKLRTGVNLTVLGMGTNQNVLDLVIQELRPNGTRRWSWNSADHVNTKEAVAAVRFTGPNTLSGDEVDLIHGNSVAEASNGDLIVSARGLNAIIRINRKTGKIAWKLGGNKPKNASTVDLVVKGDPFGGPRGQHDARLVPGGKLSLFDNQFGTTRPSRGLVYKLNVPAGTATLIYEHRNPRGEQSFGLGSMLYRSNGSAMIGWGARQPVIEELDANENRTFSFTWKSGGPQYRAEKYPLSAFNANQLRNNAGGSVQTP